MNTLCHQPVRMTVTIMSVISCSIILVVPSEAPPLLMLQHRGPTTFTTTWERESCLSRNGPNGHYYLVRYYETGSTSIPQTSNVDITSRTFTANSLTPATSYTFEVAFTNSIGLGPFSTLTITTLGYNCKSLLKLLYFNVCNT